LAFLTLKDIGKIYVSEGNVTVGIRGVNLDFELGEFVAVTGKSGSGKSTLLNVISGMDSFEEGELYIEDQPTSHYLQPDWEQYREKYISFIFQDYNIIESFTVLQNVELALLHIEDPKIRRQRALELIRRVGLVSHINHKGSKLSGGQKQRTVIARALAKDSPIILADEPTGNLDSATSVEIIELLKEVSKDKLVIVVTHNFEQLENCATRHVRIYDGAVESNHVIKSPDAAAIKERKERKAHPNDAKTLLKNGLTLGRSIFTAKPKLSVFLCLLMIVGILGVFAVTAFCGEAADLFSDYKMFNHIDGRVVITNRNGSAITEDQLKELCEEYNADSYIHYDLLLDSSHNSDIVEIVDGDDYYYVNFNCTYEEDFGNNIIGEYPKEVNEVFLYLPITFKPVFGETELEYEEIVMNRVPLKVSGVKYYYDNNLDPKCLFTKEGFDTMTAVYYIMMQSTLSIDLGVTTADGKVSETFKLSGVLPSWDIEEGKIAVFSKEYDYFLKKYGSEKCDTLITFSANYYKYNYDDFDSSRSYFVERKFVNNDLSQNQPDATAAGYYYDSALVVSPSVILDIANEMLENSYKQASLFFKNDKAASKAADELSKNGYIAVTSDTAYEPDAGEAVLMVVTCMSMALMWIMMVVFLAFFINLCTSRSLSAFKGDMAIMRSMGISVKVIRIAMYARMLISLIPAGIVMALCAIYVYTSPKLNQYFTFLYPWQYALIVLGMIILTLRITYKQVKKLFGESVKKSLKRGDSQ